MGNNYTVTIANNDADILQLTGKNIYAVDFGFNDPFHLQLEDEKEFFSEEVVRIMPKKRMVAFGRWEGKEVVAKLFYGQHAYLNAQKDFTGSKMLRKNKIPTPKLIYCGRSADKRIHVLIFERIFEANNLESIWQNKQISVDDLSRMLRRVVIELATQHVLGMLQHDLHMKNFLLTEKKVYTLDGGQIEHFPFLLPKKISMNNLALFLSQMGVGLEKYQEYLFRYYAKSRGWLLKQNDIVEMFLLIKKWNIERWERFAKKIFRASSSYVVIREWGARGMYDRAYASPEFLAFLADPDIVFDQPNVAILKAGRSATVIKINLAGHILIIKRYNIKNSWHRLRRLFRETRAKVSWRLAQKLNLFGVKTAKPVGFIDKKYLGWRGKSYFISEYISAMHLGNFFAEHQNEEQTDNMIKQVTQLLKNLSKLKITHGDLKETNILIDENLQPVLIDLDGMVEHQSTMGLRAAWRKEIKRFLANFKDKPALEEKFKAALK